MVDDPGPGEPPRDGGEAAFGAYVARIFAARRRWISALLADPESLLVRYDPAVAIVLSSTGEHIALFAVDDEGSVSRRIDDFLAGVDPRFAHLVTFGGEQSLVALFEEKRAMGQRAGFLRANDAGELTQVAGGKSAALEAAKRVVDTAPQLSDVALGEALARGQPLRRDAARFVAAVAHGTPYATLAIASVCIALFALGAYFSGGFDMGANFRMGANQGELVRRGEWWRVLASAFLHGSPLHLLVNMAALWSLGRMLERVLGVPRYVALYGLCALGGGLASAALTRGGSVGASGAIWGLMGAAIALTFRARGLLPEMARAQMKKRAFGTLAINVLISLAPGIDKYAHFGGGLVGMALVLSGAITAGVAPLWAEGVRTRGNVAWALVAGVLGVAMAASVAAALVHGTPWVLRAPPRYVRVTLPGLPVSLDMPDQLEVQPEAQVAGQPRTYLFGEPALSPVLIEVVAHPVAQPSELDLAAVLAGMRDAQKTAPAGFRLRGVPDERRESGTRFAHARYVLERDERVVLRSWHGILDGYELRIDVLTLPSRSEHWRGLEARVIGSLRVDAK